MKSTLQSLNPAKAEILGALTGDKGIFKRTRRYGFYKGYDLSRYGRCQTSICLGKDIDWGRHISEIVLRAYGSHGSIYYDRDEWRFASSSTLLFNDLSRYYQPEWNARIWRVSPHLFQSHVMTKRGFVRGYFDADGYPNLNKARRKVLVQVNSVNKFGLSGVQNLLRTIGFHPGLYRRYKKREVWELVIHRKLEVIRFLDEVGFAIRRKQDKLQEMIGQMKLR